MTHRDRMENRTRARSEIQRAHDILHFVCMPEAPALFNQRGAAICHGVHDALAWVLGFECGKSFATNLEGAVEELRRHGFEEIDMGKAVSADKARKRGLV